VTRARIVRRAATLAVAAVLLAWTSSASACPVCFAADERTRMSFLETAVLLSALPLALFVGIAFWFWRELGRSASDGPTT
jgi:protein-S-isoprenylcysteine O-methyltransferase Ste14